MKNISNSTTKTITEIACPQCRKKVPWVDDSKYRPFCSKRCQMIDFGDWAMEKNSLPSEESSEDWENFEE
ncbi:MAG: DNA gyrase inhibitor YacG [SAR86 cluster bacterium]|uniref:DNA gyrase inhibitor YacG n=1 Tax=SAR86 cluster bacterium TaxID=2030880 RepID=A0A2A5CBF1_9GAMM|nr:MAG: DNA gyrase inhibitor YacG [SAR86 cluster bacterium]